MSATYIKQNEIIKLSRILNTTDLINLPASVTCFTGDLIINNIFLGAKFQMFNDFFTNFGNLKIITMGSQNFLGEYNEINGSISQNEYCLFGNICNSANGFGWISSNILVNGIGLISTTSPTFSVPGAYGILTIYLTS